MRSLMRPRRINAELGVAGEGLDIDMYVYLFHEFREVVGCLGGCRHWAGKPLVSP